MFTRSTYILSNAPNIYFYNTETKHQLLHLNLMFFENPAKTIEEQQLNYLISGVSK